MATLQRKLGTSVVCSSSLLRGVRSHRPAAASEFSTSMTITGTTAGTAAGRAAAPRPPFLPGGSSTAAAAATATGWQRRGLPRGGCSGNSSLGFVVVVPYREMNKAAKIAKHLHKLDDMGHAKEREAAHERRQKKKDKKAAKKGKKGGGGAVSDDEEEENTDTTKHASSSSSDNPDDHEDEEEEEEQEEEEEGVLPDPKKVKVRMDDIVSKFEATLRKIRGVEPSPEMFDEVMVDAYGESTPINSVAQVVIASNTLAHATCYDPSLSKHVADAIRNKLALNPQVDDEEGVVKIPLPRMSMETRQTMAKSLGKKTENFRQKVRNVRRTVLEVVKQGVHGKLEHISKDDAFRVQQEIEKIADDAIHKLNDLTKAKEATILAV